MNTDLAVDSDRLAAGVADAGEIALIAADAVRVLVAEDVLFGGQ